MIKKLIKSKFGRSVAIIAGGTVFAQLLSFLLSPIITRIYSPEEYGVLTMYIAILELISFSTFKYEVAIPIAKNNKIAINLLALCLIVLFVFLIVLFIIILLFGESILSIFNSEIIFQFRFLIIVGVLFSGLYTILRFWNFRMQDYKAVSRTTISQSISSNFMKIFTGYLGWGPIGLILGTIMGQGFGIRVLSKSVLKQRDLLKFIEFQEIKKCFKRYKEFPIYNAPNKLLISLGSQLPIIFLTTFYGTGVVGAYGLAYSIVKLPMNLVGKAVGDVFFSEAAIIGRANPKKLKGLSNRLIKKLVLTGLIPLITLLVSGPQLFSIVFGDDWYEAGVYAQIISIMLFFILTFTPVSRIYEVFEKQKEKFLIDIGRVIFIIIVFGLAWLFNLSSYLVVLLYSIVMSIIYFITYLYAMKILNDEISKV